MKPREALETGQNDMFRLPLDQIIDMGHPKAVLARAIDWRHLAARFGECYSLGSGHPALPTRLMAGLQILKFTENLSGEVLCARWIENPLRARRFSLETHSARSFASIPAKRPLNASITNISAARSSSGTSCRLTARQ